MKLIVAGGRTFDDYPLMKRKLDQLLINSPGTVIVSGTAGGADRMGERYAKERGLVVERYPAEWDTYGKRAGYLRNELMASKADALCAFWDRQSNGTRHMIDIATKEGLQVRVINY